MTPPTQFFSDCTERVALRIDYYCHCEPVRRLVWQSVSIKNNRVQSILTGVESLGFVFFIHFCFYQIQDEAVEAFALTGSVGFDDVPLAFPYN